MSLARTVIGAPLSSETKPESNYDARKKNLMLAASPLALNTLRQTRRSSVSAGSALTPHGSSHGSSAASSPQAAALNSRQSSNGTGTEASPRESGDSAPGLSAAAIAALAGEAGEDDDDSDDNAIDKYVKEMAGKQSPQERSEDAARAPGTAVTNPDKPHHHHHHTHHHPHLHHHGTSKASPVPVVVPNVGGGCGAVDVAPSRPGRHKLETIEKNHECHINSLENS